MAFRILDIGQRSDDAPDLRLAKQNAVRASGMAFVAGLVMAPMVFAIGEPRVAGLGVVMIIGFGACLLEFAINKRLSRHLRAMTFLSLTMAPIMSFAGRGVAGFGSMMLWGFTWVVAAAIGGSRRRVIGITVLFIGELVALELLTWGFPAEAHVHPGWFRPVFVTVNLAIVAVVIAGTISPLGEGRRRLADALRVEHDRSERLLLNVLPAPIAARLKSNEATIADRFDEASVLFADLVGFTALSSRLTPEALVRLLDEIFSEFDRLAEGHGLEKIKTIGDSYMVAAGVPLPRAEHADVIVRMALQMLAVVARHPGLQVRIGINSGPVVAGVIGRRKFIYDLWGDTVNVASRMESQGVAGQIQVGPRTRELLGDRHPFVDRGEIEIKGKGPMRTWMLAGA